MSHTGSEPDDWTAAGVFEVAPGVYRIPLPLPNDGLRAVNVYAVVDGDGLVLNKLQLLPEEQTWLARPPKQPVRVPVLLYLGCNILRTGHLVRTVNDVFSLLSRATGQP